MHPVSLMIFDCDGVLIDSEMLAYGVYAKAFTDAGFPMTAYETLRKFSGSTEAAMVTMMEQEYHHQLSDAFKKSLNELVLDAFKKELQPMPGVANLLRTLREESIAFCVASNGKKERVQLALSVTGLSDYFAPEQIFDVSVVTKGKPAPDLFLAAACQHNCSPQQCLVVEDSTLGITAAQAAHMPVVGFLGGSHAHAEWYQQRVIAAAPEFIAHSMDDITARVLACEL